MKKIFTIAIIAISVFACSRKTAPPSEIIISNQEKQSSPKETINTNSVNSKMDPGQVVYTTRCNRCHGLRIVENYTQQQWDNILKIMVPKAGLNESESKQVTAYVMEHAKK
jgi:mono/diheme cytochrome c family protein